MRPLLIVGQAPSRAMQPGDRPLEGTRALTLLAKYAGVSPRERLYDIADVVNMIPRYPGPAPGRPKYDAYPEAEALRNAPRVLELMKGRQAVVFLGSAVRGTMAKHLVGEREPEWFRTFLIGADGLEVTFSPHPGGTSMYWNDPRNLAKGTAFWRQLVARFDSVDRSPDAVLGQPMSDRKTVMFTL